jgi:putative ABC transport system permease protein
LIVVKLDTINNATITAVSKSITNKFGGQVTVISASYVLDLLQSVFSLVELLLGGIAAISLLVAGIGIMNIMIVSLIERTREIGILKALGTKNRTVLNIFLTESVIVGLIGSVLGIILGWGLAEAATFVFRRGFFGGFGPNNGSMASGTLTINPVLSPLLIVGALAFGIGVSIIFALYPAWRASKLKPVDALRYE